MLDKSKVKLFKMNDYDWVVAETKEQAREWYLEETGISEEDSSFDEIIEEPLSTTFCYPLSELTDEEKNNCQFDLVVVGNENWARVPFLHTLSQMKEVPGPFMAGSTEY